MSNNSTMDAIRKSFLEQPPVSDEELMLAENSAPFPPQLTAKMERAQQLMKQTVAMERNMAKPKRLVGQSTPNGEIAMYESKVFGDKTGSNLPSYSPLNETQRFGQPQPQYRPQATTYTQAPSGGIDYSLIKMIVNEAVKEAMGNAQQLNESAVANIKMKSGGVIQLVDKKGNLYEGVLKLKQKAAE